MRAPPATRAGRTGSADSRRGSVPSSPARSVEGRQQLGPADVVQEVGHAHRREAGLAQAVARVRAVARGLEEIHALRREALVNVPQAAQGDPRAERDIDLAVARRREAQVAGQPHAARNAFRRADRMDALDVARGLHGELAVGGADVHEDGARREEIAQQGELPLDLPAVALQLLEEKLLLQERRYQHMPSYTPSTVRESQTRTKSMMVWPSLTRRGTSANSGAALPMTTVFACSSTSSMLCTIRREICGMRFRM